MSGKIDIWFDLETTDLIPIMNILLKLSAYSSDGEYFNEWLNHERC